MESSFLTREMHVWLKNLLKKGISSHWLLSCKKKYFHQILQRLELLYIHKKNRRDCLIMQQLVLLEQHFSVEKENIQHDYCDNLICLIPLLLCFLTFHKRENIL